MSDGRELALLLPWPAGPGCPPERACEVMERELAALGRDIDAVRRRARRTLNSGLDLRHDRRVPLDGGERVDLPAGQVVVIRPIRPADSHLLVRMFERLGAVSRYRRFLAAIEHLSPSQVRYLSHVDHGSHEALIALDAVSGEGVGVARYLRERTDAPAARFAVVVTDDMQGRGVGTALLTRLRARARENGIDVLHGATVAGNQAARRMLGASTLDPRSGTLQLTLRLEDDGLPPRGAPPSAGRTAPDRGAQSAVDDRGIQHRPPGHVLPDPVSC
jgi:GNAT superfamily N-acetyltransferase